MSLVSSLCAFVVLELEAATRHPEMSLAEFGVELGSRLERRLGFFEFLARLEREAGVELSRGVFRLEFEQLTVEFRCLGEIRPLEVDLGRNGVDSMRSVPVWRAFSKYSSASSSWPRK